MIRFVKPCPWQACAWVIVLFSSSPGMAGDRRPAIPTTTELRQRLLEANARIRAWYVEYESIEELAAGEAAKSYLHRVVAAKAPDRFFLWNAHGSPELDWREDPDQQRLHLIASTAIAEQPFHRSIRTWPWPGEATVPGTAQREFLCVALGWWPFEKRAPPTPGDLPTVLPAVARSLDYVVNPQQEMVDGRWCHILEYPGRDKLWVDCERNCAILAREAFDEKGRLRGRIEARGLYEVGSGIWGPREFRNIIFDPDIPNGQGAGIAKTLDALMRVLDIRVNEQVSDELFRFEPLPGSIQTEKEIIKQEFPGATNYLSDLVAWLQRRGFSPALIPYSGSATEAILEYGIIGGGVVALIGFVWCRCRNPGNIAKDVGREENAAASAGMNV
jgi:hypothetical protein